MFTFISYRTRTLTHSIEEQVIALAGVFQAAALVDLVARQGYAPEIAYEASINSILVRDPDTTLSVFGDELGIQTGLRAMTQVLAKGQADQQANIIRYSLSLIHLESKLKQNRAMLETISQGIDKAIDQTRHFPPTHPNVIKNLAGIYLDTISTFSLRIQVHGDPKHLKAQENAERIRALLLAGIRAAVLWRQTGGRRWHLIFKRRLLLETANRLLRN